MWEDVIGTPYDYYDDNSVALEWNRCVILMSGTPSDFSAQILANAKEACATSYLIG